MKSSKEIQLASKDFLKAFRENKIDTLDKCIFIPRNVATAYQTQKWALLGGLVSTIIFLVLFYICFVLDSVYYFTLAPPVIVGLIVVLMFPLFALGFAKRYFKINNELSNFIQNPHQNNFGVLLTKDYYFERSPKDYHIIARDNIIRIDYEEKRSEQELYLELLIESKNAIEIRGIVYNPNVFDFKSWIKNN